MKRTIFSLLTMLALAGSCYADIAGKSLVLKSKDGLAIQGYDPVAYFTDHKAIKGNAKFRSEYDGAKYFFASAEHKNLFDGSPLKYAPAYGGYCGYAAS